MMIRSGMMPAQHTGTNKAIFLDIAWKTGQTQLVDETIPAALRLLQEQEYAIYIVTNQPAIAHGELSEADVQRNFLALSNFLRKQRVRISGFYYCPHHPQGKQWPYVSECQCRMPMPGLLLKAAHEHHIEMEASWLISDNLCDVEAGNSAGCKTIFTGNSTGILRTFGEKQVPMHTALNLLRAAEIIVRREKQYQLVVGM